MSSRSRRSKTVAHPQGDGWDVLVTLDGDDLEIHYRHTLKS